MKRKKAVELLITVLVLTLLVSCRSDKAGSDELSKQLTFICTAGAGGDTDFNSRLLAKYLESELGATITCQNVTGSNGAIALTQYKDAKPDNATFILTNSAALSGNYATGLMDFGYEAYDPVAIYGLSSGEVILVSEDSPYQTLEELVEATKANPDSITYGGPTGGASYLACYLALVQEYGARFRFIEAGDGSERLAFLLGDHIQVCNSALLNCREYIESDTLRPLATLLSKAPSAYPDLPAACSSYPMMVQDTYYVVLALKGTDPKVIETLNSAISNVTENNEEFRNEYYSMNYQDAMSMSVEATIQMLENQKQHFSELAELMNKN